VDAGAELRGSRRRAGLSQRALARLAGVPQPTVARIETGAVVPRVDTLARLLAVCGRTLTSAPSYGDVDRTLIRDLLARTPGQRLRLAALEARNVDRFLRGVRRG
jgi:transcriptional regulator with XRE-family HTH domain